MIWKCIFFEISLFKYIIYSFNYIIYSCIWPYKIIYMYISAEIKYFIYTIFFFSLGKFCLSIYVTLIAYILSCLYLVNVHHSEGTRHIHTSREKIVGVSNWLSASAHYHIDPVCVCVCVCVVCVCVCVCVCVSQHWSFYSPLESSKIHCKQCRRASWRGTRWLHM